jgi:hypothetical protein
MPLLDDALIHCNYGSISNVVEDDKRWFDRYYLGVYAIDGSFGIINGIGVYPNMNVMDGFSLIATPDLQVNVRGSRHLANDRDSMDVGPIHAQILEPKKRWRFRLDENEQGVSYDFIYEANFPSMEVTRLVSIVDDRRVWDWGHFAHVGRIKEGWAKLDNRRIEFSPDKYYVSRDRSWGVRPGIAVIEDFRKWFQQANWGTRHNWVCVQLQSFYLWYFQSQEDDETPRHFEGLIRWHDSAGGAQEKIAKVVRRFTFEPGEHFQSCEVDVHLESGRVLPVKMKRLPLSFHLRGGNYGGKDGIIHGMDQGPLKVAGERWEPADSRVNPASMGLQEHVVEVTCEQEVGYGIFELSYGT